MQIFCTTRADLSKVLTVDACYSFPPPKGTAARARIEQHRRRRRWTRHRSAVRWTCNNTTRRVPYRNWWLQLSVVERWYGLGLGRLADGRPWWCGARFSQRWVQTTTTSQQKGLDPIGQARGDPSGCCQCSGRIALSIAGFRLSASYSQELPEARLVVCVNISSSQQSGNKQRTVF